MNSPGWLSTIVDTKAIERRRQTKRPSRDHVVRSRTKRLSFEAPEDPLPPQSERRRRGKRPSLEEAGPSRTKRPSLEGAVDLHATTRERRRRAQRSSDGGIRCRTRPTSTEEPAGLLLSGLVDRSLWVSPAARARIVGMMLEDDNDGGDGEDHSPVRANSDPSRPSSPRWDVRERRVRPLPPGRPLEETSVFVPQAAARGIASRVAVALAARGIAASYDAARARCVAPSGDSFRVRLWRGTGEGFEHGVIVEVKRRMGYYLGYDQDVYAILNAAEGQTLGQRGLGVHMGQSRTARLVSQRSHESYLSHLSSR